MKHSKTLYLETMGCQMNALDSELVLGDLTARGYRLVDDWSRAGLVILNTCSVRQHAEDKVYSRLGQIKGANRDGGCGGGERIVAVIGCMAERDGDGLLEKMSHVDILCGPSELSRLPAMVEDVATTRNRAIALSGRLRDRTTEVTGGPKHDDLESLDSGRMFAPTSHASTPKIFGRKQAYVRITRGCNKYCTFCVVPYTRGPETHRPPDQVVDEVRRLADNGVVEVTLLGQTVNHYHYSGETGGGDTRFAQLLKRVHDEVPQLPRLRFVTSFPRDFTDEALEVMASSPRICKYLHIPAQSGSNEVLRRMNRGHTVEEYIALLERARAMMPDLCIAGDMIVGFSGETEDDFQRSLDLVRMARYKNCFVFKYSPRPGTSADGRLPDDVPDEEKRRRNNDMLALQSRISLSHHRAMQGREVEVLVEGPSKSALKAQESEQSRGEEIDHGGGLRDQLVGRTQGDEIVVFNAPTESIGQFLRVRVVAATPYTLHGEVSGDSDVEVLPDTRAVSLTVIGH